MDDIKISIVIPVYNAEKYIKQQLDSLIAQTYKNIEIICVNDGSTDESERILTEYSEKYEFITTYSKLNEGVASARNLGMRHATGKYIVFQDADDFCCENMLEEAVEAAESTGAEIVVFDAYRYDDRTGQVIENNYSYLPIDTCRYGFKNIQEIRNDLLHIINVVPWNKVFLRQLLIENEIFFPSTTAFEDTVFIFEAAIVAKSVFILNKKMTYHRQGNIDSLTHRLDEVPRVAFEAFNILKNKLNSRGVFEQYKTSFYEIGIYSIPLFIGGLNNRRAFETAMNLFLGYVQEAISDDCMSEPISGKNRILENSKIVIYGAGKLAHVLVKYLIWCREIKPDKISVVVSANQINQSQICGIDVKAIDEYAPEELRNCLITVTSEAAVQAIKEELEKKGVEDYVKFGAESFASLLVENQV